MHAALRLPGAETGAALGTVVQVWAPRSEGDNPSRAGSALRLLGAVGFQTDLAALGHLLQGQDLSALPGVPPQAVRSRQLAVVAGRLCAERALLQGLELQTGLQGNGFKTAGPAGHDRLCTAATATALAPLEVGRGDAGQPVWPEGWTGSITHSSSRAVALVLPRQGAYDLGIDTEQLITSATRPAVLKLCVHPSERPMLAAAARPDLALTMLFSAKEAYYKAVYGAVRRFIDFQEVALSGWSAETGRFSIGPAPVAPGLQARSAGPCAALPQATGWFVEQGAEVLTLVAPGYGPDSWPA